MYTYIINTMITYNKNSKMSEICSLLFGIKQILQYYYKAYLFHDLFTYFTHTHTEELIIEYLT